MDNVILSESTTNNSSKKSTSKKYKCPYCEKRFERSKLHIHIQNEHEELIPEGYTALRVAFNTINNKTEGHCIICKSVTDWNEEKGRYERLCNNPKCKEEYKKMCAERNKKIYGTDRLQSDPRYAEEVQKKALAGRKISGNYKFYDGGIISYVGTYEKNFLDFMNRVMHCKSEDILAPGPAINYEFEDGSHIYLPDFYYIPYNLLIEIKDGGSNPNTHPNRIGRDEDKMKAKESAVRMGKKYNYIRLTNNDFGQLMQLMAVLKFQLDGNNNDLIVRVNESVLLNEKNNSYHKERYDLSQFKRIEKDKKSGDIRSKYIVWKDDNSKIVGKVFTDIDKASDGNIWFGTLAVSKPYRGHGLSDQILDYIISKYNSNALAVSKHNDIAVNLYKKHGFKISTTRTDKTYYYMYRNSANNESSLFFIDEDFSIQPKNIKERLYPVYIVCVGGTTFVAKAIRQATHSDFSHAAISLDANMQTLYAFNARKNPTGGRGFRFESLNNYLKDYDVNNYRLCINVFFAKESLYNALKDRLNYYVNHQADSKYDFLNLFRILFGKSIEISNDLRFVCSEFVAATMNFLGIPVLNKAISLTTPDDLAHIYTSNNKIYNLYDLDYKSFTPSKIKGKLSQVRKYAQSIIEGAYMEDMSGAIGAALPLTPNPIPYESDESNYYFIQSPKKNSVDFKYSITKDPSSYEIYSVDVDKKGFYRVFKTDKKDIGNKYLTFKIKDSRTAKELYEDLKDLYEHNGVICTDSYEVKPQDFIYFELTEGSKIIDPDQIKYDKRFELMPKLKDEIDAECKKVYEYLTGKPIYKLEEQVNELENILLEAKKSNNIVYRYTYNGKGIYNELLKRMTEDEWSRLKKSDVFTWLPLPPSYTDGPGYISYFTELGKNIFNKKVLPVMYNYLDKNKIELYEFRYPKKNVIEYEDDYQLVLRIENKLKELKQDILTEQYENSLSSTSMFNIKEYSTTNEMIRKAINAEKNGLVIMGILPGDFADANHIDGVSRKDFEEVMKKKYEKFLSLPEDLRQLSNDTALNIFGIDNYNIYAKFLADHAEKKISNTDTDKHEEIISNNECYMYTEKECKLLEEYTAMLNCISNTDRRREIKEQMMKLRWNPEIPFDREMANKMYLLEI